MLSSIGIKFFFHFPPWTIEFFKNAAAKSIQTYILKIKIRL